jgi:hypothetical protein
LHLGLSANVCLAKSKIKRSNTLIKIRQPRLIHSVTNGIFVFFEYSIFELGLRFQKLASLSPEVSTQYSNRFKNGVKEDVVENSAISSPDQADTQQYRARSDATRLADSKKRQREDLKIKARQSGNWSWLRQLVFAHTVRFLIRIWVTDSAIGFRFSIALLQM